ARRAEAPVGADEYASAREASLELAHQSGHQGRGVAAVARVTPAQAQSREPALVIEHQEREIDVTVVLRVEEAQWLLPVRWIVRRIQVEDDLGRVLGQGGDVLVFEGTRQLNHRPRSHRVLEAR